MSADVAWVDLGAPWGEAAAVRVADDAPAAALVALDPGEVLARLHPDERAAGAGLSIVRRGEWAAGRLALRAALERAGAVVDEAIGADDRGAPRVPAGWVGTISHKRGLAIAAAARDDGAKVGVDVELDAPSKIDITRRVLTPAEQAEVAAEAEPARAVMIRFAIKEAIYKAVDPYVRRYVGFQEVELAIAGESGVVTVTSGLGLAIEATWRRWEGCIVAIARARR